MVNDEEMVALDDLAAAFQLTVREESGAVTVSSRGRAILLTPGQPLASVAGRLVSLPQPLSRSGNRWMVPLEFISRALSLVYESRLELRRPSRLVVVGDLRVPRVIVRHEALPAATRLTVDATPRAASTITQEPGRLTIRFEADAIDPTISAFQSQGLAAAVRVLDPTALAVDLGPRFGSFRAVTQTIDNTSRLVLELVSATVDTAAPPPPATPPPTPPGGELPVFGQPAVAIRTIAIDPGHGGDDHGAKGLNGTLEKDVTLSVARRLKAAIEGRLGIRVLMTRDSDRQVGTVERTAVANNNKADLFISLHANGSPRPDVSGASIYLAAFEPTDAARGPSGPPVRLPVFGGGSRDIELVLWDLAQTRFLNESGHLARILEQQFQGRVPMNARAIDRAPFRVLEPANMPAVLLEMGYLTNTDEETKLAGGQFQAVVVQAVLDAIVEFRDTIASGGAR